MKSRNLTAFLAGFVFLFAAAGMNALAAQPEDTASPHEVYAPAGHIVYKIDTMTGDYEIAGDGYYPVLDVMKTENGLYGLTGETDDTLPDLRVFSESGSEYVSYHVTDMVGECNGKFYFLKDALGPNKELYSYDPATGDTGKAISPEIFDAETDGELLYASVLHIDEEHPEGVCRIGYGPNRETGKWSLLRVLEDGAEYLPEIVKGTDGVYFFHASPVAEQEKDVTEEQEEDLASAGQEEDVTEEQEEGTVSAGQQEGVTEEQEEGTVSAGQQEGVTEEQEEDAVSIILYKLEYAEPHNCIVMASFTIPADAEVRLVDVTDAAAVVEYQDASDREVYLLRFEDGNALNFGYLTPEEEFPPIIPAGDNFYTVFGDSTICLVDTETNVQEIMTLPVDAKIWDAAGSKAVFSLNGSLYLADAEKIPVGQTDPEAKEDITEDLTEADAEGIRKEQTEADAREALSGVLLQYIEELQAPSVFFEKVLEDPVTAALLEETKGSFEVSLDLKLDESLDEMPVTAEFCVEKAEEEYRINGSAMFGGYETATIEFELDTESGSLKISAYDQTETIDLSSLLEIYEKTLPALVPGKGSEAFGKEALALFLGSRELSAMEDTFSYPELTEDKKIQNVTKPCMTYKMMIGWDEVLNYLHLFTEQMESLYTTMQDVFGYRPSFDNGLDLEENIESAVAEMQKYSPDGIEVSFHVLEDELAGVSIGIRMSEDAVMAHSPDGKPVMTQRIGDDTEPAGVLITADLTRKTVQAWNPGEEIIRDLGARLTAKVVNEQGDDNTEYLNMALTESKTTDDYERWNRSVYLYVGMKQFQVNHAYIPDQENRPGPSYQLHVSPDTFNLGSSKGISVFLNEAKEQDDEGISLSVLVLSGSEKYIDGTVTIRKIPD